MYSLLCRHARINAFSQVEEEDAKTGTATPDDAQRCSSSSSLLERSRPMQKALLGVVLIGTAFMMCDGVLSPAASGESARAQTSCTGSFKLHTLLAVLLMGPAFMMCDDMLRW